jgi:hypothetical protein
MERMADTVDTDPAAAAVVLTLLALDEHRKAERPLHDAFVAAAKAAPHWTDNPANLIAVGWEDMIPILHGED